MWEITRLYKGLGQTPESCIILPDKVEPRSVSPFVVGTRRRDRGQTERAVRIGFEGVCVCGVSVLRSFNGVR